MKDSGDNRLSRQRHYHRPGGLNGRVRDGNGCDPASMVAGKALRPAVRHGGARFSEVSHTRRHKPVLIALAIARALQMSGFCSTPVQIRSCQKRLTAMISPPIGSWTLAALFALLQEKQSEAAPRSGWSSCLAVRTGRLKRSLAVHARPIDLVVFQEPTHFCWKPHLGGGFALRCLQRLSCPDLATRRCPERDSRHTRGRSSPILSY